MGAGPPQNTMLRNCMCNCRLGIPDTEYAATIKMPSTEFARICK